MHSNCNLKFAIVCFLKDLLQGKLYSHKHSYGAVPFTFALLYNSYRIGDIDTIANWL